MLLWVCWQITTITGVVFGATIPAEWSLEFAIPLTFIAVVVPILRRRADFIACGTAAVISVIGQPLPWNSWIILAGIGGILAGWLTLYTAAGRSNA
jgi:predicted branched-subunit amino acid permease